MYAPKTVLVSEEQAAKDRQTLQDPRVAAMAAQLKPFMRDKLNDPINLRFFLSGLEDCKNAAGNRPSEQELSVPKSKRHEGKRSNNFKMRS